nr:endo-1,4-beta-xylanase [uncultured Flavobacterium sp.]
MKYKYIIPIIASSLMTLASCDDNLMEWKKVEGHGEIASSELPLELAEKITRYEPLKNYSTFNLGNGIGVSLYLEDETYRSIVNANFDEVVPGYEMKHGAMVKSNGSIDFTTMDKFVTETKKAGLSIYGHTLAWHSNNNASYLNSLIAPTIIPGSSGPNSLNLAGLLDGSFSGWSKNNPGAGITVVDGAGLVSGTKAMKLVSSATSSQAYNLQVYTPNISAVSGHRYEISFFIKSDVPGKGRVSFDSNITAQYMPDFTTNGTWTQIKFTKNDVKSGSTAFKLALDLGYLPNVTYYVDVNSFAIVDLDAAPTIVNLITNGDFENGSISQWTAGSSNGSTAKISTNGAGYGGSGYAMELTNPVAKSNYSAQRVFTLSAPLVQGKQYNFTFWVKADVPASLQVEIQNPSYAGDYSGDFAVGTSWTQITKIITPSTADKNKLVFDFGATAATFTIDNIVLTDGSTTGGGAGTPSITIEKTDAEKATIIDAAMTDWISKMMTHFKNDVHAWDVVNEPVKEDGSLRDGVVTDMANDEFYWVKYLGKDYAVKAFKLARQYGNSTDKLFINDYNLESRLDKCDGLINYVKYIESQGATVDGIGTQMHISLTTDKTKIDQMFQKLAASGKLIKISELDIRLGTKSPTAVQLADQSAMYQFVIDSYKKYIPAAQQYGITIWGVSDNEQEHEYWLPNESPNVWDASYKRKHAYKGTADGLAGKDVSKDFSGELQP